MQMNPYLTFNGQCEAAFRFYEKRLGAKIGSMISHAGTPSEAHVPAEWRNKIMHATLQFEDSVLMGADTPPDRYEPPKGFSISISLEDPAEAERIFQALSEGGSVRMPIQQTFWAKRFGMLVDQFGIPWMINCSAAQPHDGN